MPWSKARGSCQKTSDNQPYSQVWISFGDSIPELYCVAWLTQESVSSRIFVRKKGMNHVQSNGRSQQTPSAKGRKGRHFRWLEKLSRSPFIKGREYLTITELSQCKKHTNYPHQVERSCKLEVLKRQQASK
jgi:hypothetical protein